MRKFLDRCETCERFALRLGSWGGDGRKIWLCGRCYRAVTDVMSEYPWFTHAPGARAA